MDLKRELDAMGGPAANSRGEMIHLILTLCRKFETAFGKLIDGGKGGKGLLLKLLLFSEGNPGGHLAAVLHSALSHSLSLVLSEECKVTEGFVRLASSSSAISYIQHYPIHCLSFLCRW
jgi:hypothetical protein